jgi:purine-cytosine permease-like protein
LVALFVVVAGLALTLSLVSDPQVKVAAGIGFGCAILVFAALAVVSYTRIATAKRRR